MKRTSSYISFENPYYKKTSKSKENVIVIDIDSIINRLMDEFQLTEDSIDSNAFKHCFNARIDDCDVNIKIYEVNVATYITVEVFGKTQAKIINCLESFQNSLDNINGDNRYVIIISYDFISEYYCNKMYPKLNELERNLRKLIFNTYTLNFGLKYYEPTVDKSIQDKSKGIIKASGNKINKELKFIREFPYSLDYNQIQELLFTKH